VEVQIPACTDPIKLSSLMHNQTKSRVTSLVLATWYHISPHEMFQLEVVTTSS
jgi:hypothetical protein